MFQIVAVPFDAFRQLPSPSHRWLLTCLIRYADKGGRCWPNMRQLAEDARMSLSTVSRRLKEMADLAVFHRERKGVGRYVYQLAEAYVPRWPGRVSGCERRVPQQETQKSNHKKQKEDAHGFDLQEGSPWKPRLRGWVNRRFWLPQWGPTPEEPGCFAPLLAADPPSQDHGNR